MKPFTATVLLRFYLRVSIFFQCLSVAPQFFQRTRRCSTLQIGETVEITARVSLSHVTMVTRTQNVARWSVMRHDGGWNPVHSSVFVSDETKTCTVHFYLNVYHHFAPAILWKRLKWLSEIFTIS